MDVDPKQNSVETLFDEFVNSRQNGINRDEAWFGVLDKANYLTEGQVKRLLGMARQWEAHEGYQYRYHDRRDKNSTRPKIDSSDRKDRIVTSPLPQLPTAPPPPPLAPNLSQLCNQTSLQRLPCRNMKPSRPPFRIALPTSHAASGASNPKK